MEKGKKVLVAFTGIYILAFLVYYLFDKNYEFVWYTLILVVAAIIILATLKKTKLDMLALWGLSLWGLLHMLGGSLMIWGKTLYSLKLIEIVNRGGDFYILKMDQVIHFYGFAVAALVVYELIAPFMQKNRGRAMFIAWIGGMGLGALNEVVEFLAFVVLSQTGVGDMYNTGLDLVFNMFGAVLGAYLGYRASRAR